MFGFFGRGLFFVKAVCAFAFYRKPTFQKLPFLCFFWGGHGGLPVWVSAQKEEPNGREESQNGRRGR
jgi:hypothetical protein